MMKLSYIHNTHIVYLFKNVIIKFVNNLHTFNKILTNKKIIFNVFFLHIIFYIYIF